MRKMEIVGIGIVIVVGGLLWPNSGSSHGTYGSASPNNGSQVGGDDVLHGLDIARELGGQAYQPYRKHHPPRVPHIRVEPGVEPHLPR
jgi:hypothetical protein